MVANEFSYGAWVGKGKQSSGTSYDNYEFYDGTKLNQCYEKECSSGEGKFTMLKVWIEYIYNI